MCLGGVAVGGRGSICSGGLAVSLLLLWWVAIWLLLLLLGWVPISGLLLLGGISVSRLLLLRGVAWVSLRGCVVGVVTAVAVRVALRMALGMALCLTLRLWRVEGVGRGLGGLLFLHVLCQHVISHRIEGREVLGGGADTTGATATATGSGGGGASLMKAMGAV